MGWRQQDTFIPTDAVDVFFLEYNPSFLLVLSLSLFYNSKVSFVFQSLCQQVGPLSQRTAPTLLTLTFPGNLYKIYISKSEVKRIRSISLWMELKYLEIH